MKVMVLNGPNLNMLGIRETEIYGEKTYDEICQELKEFAEKKDCEVDIRQTNHEGVLIDWIQEAYYEHYDGVIINPAGYTHTSIALADAVKAIEPLPVIEVHLSDPDLREEYRHVSYLRPFCLSSVKGIGPVGYRLALERLCNHVRGEQ